MKSSSLFSRLLIFIILLIIIHSNLLAQQDSLSIQQRILQSQETDQVMIMRTREFIFNKLKEGSISEAFEAYKYVINEYEKGNIKPFWVEEKFLLSFWFGNYDLVYKADSIESIINSEIGNFGYSYQDLLYPQRDKMYVELRHMSNKNREKLIQQVDSLVSDGEKHDYLVLFFDRFAFNAVDSAMSYQEETEYLENNITPRAENFLAKYKDSQFKNFALKHFRFVYKLSDWGWGLQLGLGSIIPQGIASDYLNTEVSLGLEFNLSWKNILLGAGYDIGFPREFKKPFVYEEKNWDTGIKHNYYPYYFYTGFVASENRLFKITPHLGIGGMYMSVCDGDKDKAVNDLSMAQTVLQYGITCDIKFDLTHPSFNENTYSYYGISIMLDYNQFLGYNPILDGGIFRLRISWIGFMRSFIRDI
jgi:hypothetical protein